MLLVNFRMINLSNSKHDSGSYRLIGFSILRSGLLAHLWHVTTLIRTLLNKNGATCIKRIPWYDLNLA